MPSNIEHENISAIKLGIVDMTKGYIGHNEVYPNSREIQSAAFTSTSTLSRSGGTRLFRVTGETGATYDLSGSAPGSYILSTSPYDHSIPVGSNTSCDAPARTITATLTPTGSTTLQGGGSSFSSSFTQQAGYTSGTTSLTGSMVATNTNRVTTTVGSNLYWAAGSTWDVTWSYNCSIAYSGSGGMALGVSGSSTTGTTFGNGSSASGTFSYYLGSTVSTVRFYFNINSAHGTNPCNECSPDDLTTGYLYP